MLIVVRRGIKNREQSLFCCTNLMFTQTLCASGSFISKGAQVTGMSPALALLPVILGTWHSRGRHFGLQLVGFFPIPSIIYFQIERDHNSK